MKELLFRNICSTQSDIESPPPLLKYKTVEIIITDEDE